MYSFVYLFFCTIFVFKEMMYGRKRLLEKIIIFLVLGH